MASDGLYLSDGSFFSFAVSPADREGQSLQIAVTLTNAEVVDRLRADVAARDLMISELKESVRQLEYGFRCETLLNLELHDLCKANGIKIRPSMGRGRRLGTS